MTEDELYLMSNKELRSHCSYIQDKLTTFEDDKRQALKKWADKYFELEDKYNKEINIRDKEIRFFNNSLCTKDQAIAQHLDHIEVLKQINESIETRIERWKYYSFVISVSFMFLLFVMFAASYSRS